MRILALDLSLKSTGFAVADGGKIVRHGIVTEPNRVGVERLIQMRNKVMDVVDEVEPELIFVEDIAFSANQAYAKENAGLAYILRVEWVTEGIPYFMIAATQVKKYCCGTAGSVKDKVGKDRVMKDLFVRFGHNVNSNDEADAIIIGYIGMASVGESNPTIEAQRDVLKKITVANPSLRKFTSSLEVGAR